MRDRHEELTATGATVASIGMGTPAMAADFRSKYAMPFPLLVDHDRRTYRLLELARGSIMDIVGPRVWLRAAKGLVGGHGAKLAQQDPFQLAGAAIVDPDASVRFLHRAKDSSDNVPVDELLRRLA